MKSFVSALFLGFVVSASYGAELPVPGGDIQNNVDYNLIATGPHGSLLYNIAASSSYDDDVQLLDLVAPSSFEQGFDMAFLLSDQIIENYDTVLGYLLGDDWYEPALALLTSRFLDWQWDNYMSVQVPNEFMEEIRGMTAGGRAVGATNDIGRIASRITVLANFPGDLSHLEYVFEDEAAHPPSASSMGGGGFFAHYNISTEVLRKDLLTRMQRRVQWRGLGCSMFGVWGQRTQGSNVYSGRNLDWYPEMGIAKHKLVTVFHSPPAAGGIPHATVGWAGFLGAITGMSAEGVTVHEANLESDDITFRGFPWVLRLRYVMARAKGLDEALNLWNSTNNTIGFNHGIASRSDGSAVVMETMIRRQRPS
jgi:hypothetical protein